jgi:glutaredoxin
MKQIILYTTSGCHLCEQAKALLEPYLVSRRLWLKEVEIADSDDLIDRYGVRIPVIALANSGAELNWPFDSQELEDFVRRQVQI